MVTHHQTNKSTDKSQVVHKIEVKPLEELSDGIYFVDHSSKNVVNSNGMAMVNIVHIGKNLNT